MATTDEIIGKTVPSQLVDHNLVGQDVESFCGGMVRYEKRPARRRDGSTAEGLFNAWIIINNPKQYNSYTTDMVKALILAFRRASVDREVNAVVFTGTGEKAFCTGGNTKEYAEYYAGNPQEYRQYMRLFNDMVSAILGCDKPVIARVNGMRIGGGQEIGMACDFTISQDLARSGHKAYRLGVVLDIVPALKVDDKFVANPLVETRRYLDEYGRIIHGEPLTGAALAAGKAVVARGAVDLSLLDAKVEAMCTKLMTTFPECLTKSFEELRKPKIDAWNRNKENSRAWLALNMMAEARTGFRAFNEGPKNEREIDFVALRQRLANGEGWTETMIEELIPKAGMAKAGGHKA